MIYLGFPIGSSRSVGSSEYLSATTGTIREQTGQMNIAIVGTGVSGLVCAHLLSRAHDVTVFEADARPGGHAHTVTVELRDGSFDVDTGFLVYNERNYPGLIRLFDDLGVPTKPSDMSFSVTDEVTGLEWKGSTFDTVFAQRRNLARPSFLRMLADIVRFNRMARGLLEDPHDAAVSLGDLLDRGRWSSQFLNWYLVPMGSSIWSADPSTFLAMPAVTFARFFANHGLLEYGNQPSWRTVEGGSRRYVDAVLAPLGSAVRLEQPVDKVTRSEDEVELHTADGPERFDHVVIATHSDQALDLLSDPSRLEREVLGAIRFQPNRATLHTDVSLLPANRRAWASWNYHRLPDHPTEATLTYRLRSLQGVASRDELLITLNRDDAIDPATVLRTFDYSHPVYDSAAIAAQRRQEELNGVQRTWYCGAYWGYGFHEDGVQSARVVCRRLAGVDL
jgi:predicted NAD/FAD-binding protein